MLIVLEGLDGAGKSTQVSLLDKYLRLKCGSLKYIHFPRYDSPVYGTLISRFLRGDFGSVDKVHPQLVALLFAEDRHGACETIKAELAKGGTVLLDRYVYSNIAYQCAKLDSGNEAEELRKWIIDTEYGAFNLPRPDLNLFVDAPMEFIENSLCSHRDGADRNYLEGASDIHEADISFQRKVRAMYLRQASLDPSFKRIDCASEDGKMLPAESIFTKIKDRVDEILK